MNRLRFRESASLALLMAFAITEFAIAQGPQAVDPLIGYSRSPNSGTGEPTARSYKIYALDDFGNDPGFCEWIARTIPDVIATGTWSGAGVIRYYAPKNILVVCHTAAVQAQVDGFLKDVKKSLSATTKAKAAASKNHTSASEVVPTLYLAPQSPVATNPAAVPGHSSPAPEAAKPEPSLSYPVPAPAKPPKHLFHFIIRYEGEGIIDDNVVKMMKDYVRAQSKALQQAPADLSPAPAPTVPAPGYVPASPPSSPVPAVIGSYNAPASPPSSPPPGVTPPYGVPTETAPAAPTPAVKEKEDKKDDKSPEKEKQAPLKTTR